MSGLLWKATVRNVNRALKEINAFEWEGDYRPAAREALRRILEDRVDEELGQYLGRGRYERCGEGVWGDYRNGSRIRHVLTELGDLMVRMPRTRKKFESRVLEAYRRRMRTVDQLMLACFVLGMSTRKVSTALFSLLGERVSASTVSEVAKGLDREVKRYHERKLSDGYRFLFFDGVVLKQKGAAKVQKKIILCAYGMTWEGKKEMIDFLLATSESQNAWEGFLRDLYERGLEGKVSEMITTDGGKGLLEALEVVYPRIPRQHCWAHKTRNVLDKVKKVDQEKVKKDLHRISYAKSRQLATQAYWAFCQKYRKLYPGAVKSLESEIENLLSFYQVKLSPTERKGRGTQELQKAQEALWRRVRTTNPIERAFREVRRRTRPMGVFVNRNSMERILFAVFFHLNSKGQEVPSLLFTQNA
ncbi:MAG TPA: IS256 family transposase [Thermodesulfobacteriota bacterium]|nr:IS256 family transposase [Thermodesulfobacteriota bacterium]